MWGKLFTSWGKMAAWNGVLVVVVKADIMVAFRRPLNSNMDIHGMEQWAEVISLTAWKMWVQ